MATFCKLRKQRLKRLRDLLKILPSGGAGWEQVCLTPGSEVSLVNQGRRVETLGREARLAGGLSLKETIQQRLGCEVSARKDFSSSPRKPEASQPNGQSMRKTGAHRQKYNRYTQRHIHTDTQIQK